MVGRIGKQLGVFVGVDLFSTDACHELQSPLASLGMNDELAKLIHLGFWQKSKAFVGTLGNSANLKAFNTGAQLDARNVCGGSQGGGYAGALQDWFWAPHGYASLARPRQTMVAQARDITSGAMSGTYSKERQENLSASACVFWPGVHLFH